MKKVMRLVSVAAMLISGNAMALAANPAVARPVMVAGQRAGIARIALVGPGPSTPATPFGSCRYRMFWGPDGAGSALPCDLLEVGTTDSMGCFLNQNANFPTSVLAGPTVGTNCSGFDQNGISYVASGITLTLSTAPGVLTPNLFGTVIYPGMPFPQSIAF